MNRTITLIVALAITAGAFAPITAADADRAEGDDPQATLDALLATPSRLGEAETVDVLLAHVAGADVSDADLVEAVKYVRDLDGRATDASTSFAETLGAAVLQDGFAALARELVRDQEGYDAFLASGKVATMAPADVRATVETFGLDPAGFVANAGILATVPGAPAIPDPFSLPCFGTSASEVYYQQGWDCYGFVVTLTYLAVLLAEPGVGSELIPHNLRVNALDISTRTTSGQVGTSREGYLYAQVDAEALAGVALDQHANVDTLLLQLPVSVRVEVHYREQCVWGICAPIVTGIVITTPPTLIARNAVFDFAYPVESGSFPTRAESMDLFQSLYDRLGTLAYQTGRDFTSAPVYPDTPGLGDLSTQAPIVSRYGIQTPPPPALGPEDVVPPAVANAVDAALDLVGPVPPLPATPNEVDGAVATARDAIAPYMPGPVDPNTGLVPSVYTRVRGDFGTAPVPVDPTGVVAGYTASEIRAWNLNILVVRWHNVGAASTGAIGEAPASIYYDAMGHYVRGSGNVYTSDWSIVEDLDGVHGAVPA